MFRYIYTTLFATRVSLELHGVEIPEGYLACHHCDNPGCVNPRHLYPGTRLDNARDARERGQYPRGERVHTARLTEVQVLEMRRLYAGGARIVDIARQMEATYNQVSGVVHRRVWRHLP